MNKYEIYNLESGYLITIDDEVTHYDFYDVPKQIVNIIKQLEQENNQLKEQRQELRSWLEDKVFNLNSIFDRDIYEEQMMLDFSNILIKLNELEEGKND